MMTTRRDHLTLVAFAEPNFFHQSNPQALRDSHRFELSNYIAHARRAEAAGFDAIFKPDFLGFDSSADEIRARAGFEPLTLLTALSQHTDRLGLIATQSTTYNEPFNVARYFTSLDNLSQGRSAWNVVTSYNGEANFGAGEFLPLAERYQRAEEFMEVTYKLWRGWKTGAQAYGPEGPFISGRHIEETRFQGKYFRVKEALDIPPGPQGRPVIVQAGASDEGLDFAARHAEIDFTATPHQEAALAFYSDLKRRVVQAGRDARDLKILPGLNIFVASSKSEAQDLHRTQFTDKNLLEYRKKVLREAPLFKLDELHLDEKIPRSAIPSVEALARGERRRSRALLLHPYLDRPGITLREFLSSIYEFGHLTLIGTAESVADEMADWFNKRAVDGFVFKGGNDFARVANEINPILRSKGLLTPVRDERRTFREVLSSK